MVDLKDKKLSEEDSSAVNGGIAITAATSEIEAARIPTTLKENLTNKVAFENKFDSNLTNNIAYANEENAAIIENKLNVLRSNLTNQANLGNKINDLSPNKTKGVWVK